MGSGGGCVTDERAGHTSRLALWGPMSGLGLGIALVAGGLDQAYKLYMLFAFDIADRQPLALSPFLDLILVWNKGVSYGLFQQETAAGQWLLLAFKAAAVIGLTLWLARITTKFSAVAIGLIIGGAIANAVDQLAYGAVADFFY